MTTMRKVSLLKLVNLFAIFTLCFSAGCGSALQLAKPPIANNQAVAATPPTVNLTVNGSTNPGQVAYQTTVTVAWTSANATSCTVVQKNPTGTVSVGSPASLSGSASVLLYLNSTFTVNCTGTGGTANATVPMFVDTPTNQMVFVSSSGNFTGSFTSGSLTGLAAANAICQSLAKTANLRPERTWMAVLSDGNTSANSLAIQLPVVNNATPNQVINSASDFFSNVSTLMNSISYDENGHLVSNSQDATADTWTGTNHDGSESGVNCDHWKSSSSSDFGTLGSSGTLQTGNWMNQNNDSCNKMHHIYCINL